MCNFSIFHLRLNRQIEGFSRDQVEIRVSVDRLNAETKISVSIAFHLSDENFELTSTV